LRETESLEQRVGRIAAATSPPLSIIFTIHLLKRLSPISYPKLDPQLKENDYTITVKKVTAKARNAEKVKKVEHFPKPSVFLRFFPPD
jgi:hypothetical protein